MTVILEFRQQREPTAAVRAEPERKHPAQSAEVIIFPGVRINRGVAPAHAADRTCEGAAKPGAVARTGGPDSVED